MSELFEKIPNPDLKVKVPGIIKNMSWFTPEQHPDEKHYIFGKGGGHKLAIEFDTFLLGHIPLVMKVGEAAEKGPSIFSQNNKQVVDSFEKNAGLLISKPEVNC